MNALGSPGWSASGVRRSFALAIALLAGGRPAAALDPARAITQYVQDTWTAKDGAPAGTITGIAQGPRGYLWLGTDGAGLVRFDGVSFVREVGLDAALGHRADRITSLICARDGTLWIGTTYGLVRRRGGIWTAFDTGPARDVYGLHEAADGTVYYARHWEGVYSVSGDTLTFRRLEGKPRFVTSDSRGTIWVGGYEGLWRLAGANERRYSAEDGLADPDVTQVYGDGTGRVWVGLQVGLCLLIGDHLTRRFTMADGLSSDEIDALLVDRDGSLWVGTVTGGLNRKRGERFESLRKSQGLTNDRVTAIYEDREGSLWVGTASGLNRLRDSWLLPLGANEGLSPRQPLSIVQSRDGTVIVSSGFDGINRIRNGRVSLVRAQSVTGSNFDGPLYADPDGGVWSGHRDGLSYRERGRAALFPVHGQVTAITRDARSLVFAVATGEVYRLVRGKPERFRLADGSPLGPERQGFDYVWMLHVARDGGLWLATSRGAFVVRAGELRRVWHQDALSVRSVSEDERGVMWLATMAGLVRIAGESVTPFTSRDGLPEDDIHYALSDGRGGVWLSGASGISRLSRQDLEGTARPFAVERFGTEEGMRTPVAVAIYQPSALAADDGRLWFTTAEGVVVVDPEGRRKNALVPPVVVEAVVADGEPLALTDPVGIPPGVEQLEIHYNGLSLLNPRRVRFKYRLAGYDKDWIDAEGRRVAYYTRLPPGDYTFRVSAANNDGLWNETGASLAIRQIPRLYQTPWFALAAGVLLAGTAWTAHRLRVRRHERVEEELQGRIRDAVAEIKTLNGLLPICAWCKKVRDDTGYWDQIENYVREHTDAEFSHGICPDCRLRMASEDGRGAI